MKDATFTVYLLLLLFLLPYGKSMQDDKSTWLEFQPMPGQPNSLTWEVPPGTLPFTGSYQFFAELSTPVFHLLSIVEAQTGLTLAECHLAAPTSPQWRSFTWQLDAHSLQCNASSVDAGNVPEHVEHPLPPLPSDSHQPRSFLVRIMPQGGAFCMRNLIVRHEFARGCPPKLNAAMTPSPAGGGLLCHQCSLIAQLLPQQEQQSTRPRLQISKLPPSTVRPTSSSQGDESSISINEGDGREQQGQQPQHHPGRVSATGAVSGNSELGVPIAFPLFRPTHSTPTNAGSLVTVSESHDSDDGGSDDEHLSRATQEKFKFAGPLHSHPNTREPFAAAGGASGGNSQTQTSMARHDPCPHFECKNRGRCVTSEDARPICLCQPGFTGLRCEVDLCAAIACPGSSECKFRSGRAVCECKDGPAGDNCRLQMKQRVVSSINGGASGAPPVIVCAHECANGGQCVALGGNNNVSPTLGGGVNGICRCAHGFLGANCNIRDLCADNATCALFGHKAKCFVDAASLETKAPVNFVNSPHVCMCDAENGQWVDCSQVVRRLDLNLSTPAGRNTANGSHLPTPGSEVQETPHIGTMPKSFLEPRLGSPAIQQPVSSTNGPVENVEEPHRRFNLPFSGQPPPSATTTRRTSITPIRETGGASEGGSVMHQQHRRPSSPNTQQPPFPIHVPTGHVGDQSDSTQSQSTTSSQDDTSDGGSEGESAGLQPHFPFTTPAPGILPAGNGPVRGRPTGGQSSSRLKVLSGSSTTTTARLSVSTTTTQEPIITRPVLLPRLPPPGLGDEDEKAGDNGFERVTAHLDPTLAAAKSNSTPATTTTTVRPTTTSPTTTTTTTSATTTTTRTETTALANTTASPPSNTTTDQPTTTLSTEPLFPHSTEESNHVGEVEESLDHTSSPPVEVQTVDSFHPTDDSRPVFETTTVSGGGNSVMSGMGDEELGPTGRKAENGEAGGNDAGAASGKEDAQTEGQSSRSKSSNNDHLVMANNILSWIVAIGVIAFFLLSVASGTFCVGRYVRRSRRLHGKYNPAREETAAANTYSMPMTTVSDLNPKEERLI